MTSGARTSPNRGVAITGMACLFPGAPDLDAYWRNILGKVDAISDPPAEAWDPDVYYDPEFADEDKTYCKRGGYLGSLATFEPLGHGIPPVSVGGEPDQWLALQVAHDALADAGATELDPDVRTRTAIILGKGTYLNGGNAIAVQRGLVIGQTIELIRRLHPEHSEAELERLRTEMQNVLPSLGPETVPGLIPNIIVGRIANRLDLMGPAYTVDAACASSLVAVQHAVRDLLAGDCDLALAGGSQVWMPVATMNLFCRLGALSRRQQLRAFDKDADGTLLGEGIGMVVLKRVEDAERDGDRIYAVLRGVGVASDGRGMSVMAPRIDGEELALRRAYEDAAVSPATVGLIEAHGTGTPVGDATEIEALTRVFGTREGELPHCAIGTVKSMISHTIPAAGVAGLIKTALALHHRILPPTLHCDEPNPKLGLERSPFYINTETRPWIHGAPEPRRAGVNAFGFGGINAHAVLEEWTADAEAADHRPPWDTELCVLAGQSATALADAAERLLAAVEAVEAEAAWTLTDVAYTLARGLEQSDGTLRLAIVASSLPDLAKKLRQAASKLRDPDCRRIKAVSGIYFDAEPFGADGKVVFVFPGEGAQYPNMLADLCLHFPEARATFDRIDRLYVDHPRGHLLSDWVFPRPAFSEEERSRAEARLMELDIAVESVLTANAAVYEVVSRLVRRVDAMLGHSTGEHSAAMAAGALDLETDERLATFCHGLHASYADAASRHEVPGAVLLATGTDADTARAIAEEAGGELHLAMDNCPHQTVLVGEAEAAGRAREIAVARGIMCEVLPYDRAVHTPLFEPFAEDLRTVFEQLPVRGASREVWSCTTAAPYPAEESAIRELLVEHWTSPVRFRETVEALHDAGARVFVEIGPRGNMTSFVDDILRGRRFCAVAADNRRRSGVTQLNHLAGMLAVHGVELDLDYLFVGRGAAELDLDAPASGDEPAAPRRPISLSTAWPMVRLSDDALGRVRGPDGPAAPAHADRPPAPVPANGNGHPTAPILVDAPPSAPVSPSAPTPPLTPAPPPAPAAPLAPVPAAAAPVPVTVAPSEDAAADALDDHLATMSRFLETSADVMRAYLDGGAAVAIEQARRPLIGTIVQWDPERELVARRVLDTGEDRYLLDHTLGRRVSHHDPELAALTVMPLAMSIEILAEAAACLLPDLTVRGLRDIRATRWLVATDAPKTLEVHARRLTDDASGARVTVELRELGDGAPAAPVVLATVLLGDGYAPAPEPSVAAPSNGRAASRAGAALYGDVMFHGPLWQGVEALDTIGDGGVTARLRVLPRTELLASNEAPAFVLDPVILDAAGQLVGFWAAETLDEAHVVFPFHADAVEVFAAPSAPGEAQLCAAAISLQDGPLVSSDIEVVGSGGRVSMRITGWQDKRFAIPEPFAPLAHASALSSLSSPWEVGPSSPSSVCRRLDTRLGSDAALWAQVWAARVLTRREREMFARLGTNLTRQLEWLGARTAAKEAVSDLLRTQRGIALLPADVEILTDEQGRPVAGLPGLELPDAAPIVSLSHTDGEAAALCMLVPTPSAVGVGIDIARMGPPPGFAETAFSDAELHLLASVPAADADEWVLRCWSAREAAGKSLGRGLITGSGGPKVTAIDVPSERVTVDVAGRAIAVDTRRDGELIVATAVCNQGDPA